MDEIERIIALVKTYDGQNLAALDMKYSFSSRQHIDDFFKRVAESNFTGGLIPAKKINNVYVAGLRVVVPLNADTMRELCHRYRQLAYEFDGMPLKWALRVKA